MTTQMLFPLLLWLVVDMCGEEEGGSGQYDYISQLDSSEEGEERRKRKKEKGWRDHCDDGGRAVCLHFYRVFCSVLFLTY